MTETPTPPANSKPFLTVEEIFRQIQTKAATLADMDADVLRIVAEHLLTAHPALDAVERATDALVSSAERATEPV